ncbi:hypothetical protein Pcinc_006175 [Petrolisthes cinctipes]|uniref:Uncharacterized protein n=1 Tax=Petrolisthes cinctipes TaxID=88211 RepID=A0AAE1GDP3_PETCI|nr:hypothetical protein Pcinc_006175 [Petrolisthes cinctipes]
MEDKEITWSNDEEAVDGGERSSSSDVMDFSTEPQEEEEEVVEEGEISGKISGLAQDTAVVLPPDFLLTFQTIRRVKSDEVSDITRQLQRLEEYQNLEE